MNGGELQLGGTDEQAEGWTSWTSWSLPAARRQAPGNRSHAVIGEPWRMRGRGGGNGGGAAGERGSSRAGLETGKRTKDGADRRLGLRDPTHTRFRALGL